MNAETQPTVAVLGASQRREKFGNKSVRAHRHAGWKVIPVNLDARVQEVEGLASVQRLGQVDEALQRITLYLPPPVVEELLEEIAAAGAEEVWFNPGTHTPPLLAKARALGVNAVVGCSIVDLGLSPSQFP
ncbi:MAG: CoA-binding protein [Acidobacteriota bacterium]